jgi:tetratricopeptide (TPR) repeat protein
MKTLTKPQFEQLLTMLIPALAVVLIYLPALGYSFVWDDTIFLRDWPLYRETGVGLDVLFRPFVLSPNYFRPLALLTFMGELRLAGLNPAVFHLTNLLLHALNTALLVILARRFLGGAGPSNGRPFSYQIIPLLAGLLYGLHPALLEGVAFVSSRFDLLMTTCLLLALLADDAVRHPVWRPLLVGLAFLLAALAKEMALAFVLALPFWHLAQAARRAQASNGAQTPETNPEAASKGVLPWLAQFKRAFTDREDVRVYLAVFLAGGVYLGVRYASLGYILLPPAGDAIQPGGWLQHLLLVAKSLAGYFLLVVWPFTSLAPIHYSPLPVPPGDPLAWSAVLFDGLVIAGLLAWTQRAPDSGWLALAGVAALLPVSNLLPLELGGGAIIAERFLLFPLTLLALASVDFLRAGFSPGRARWLQALLAAWLVMCVAALQLSLPNWRDDLSLWSWAGQKAPRSATPPTNLALEYVQRGQYPQAAQWAQRGIDLDPQNPDAWDNLGLALFHQASYAEAQKAFEQAISLQPKSALFWNNLAGALREQGDLAQAEKVLLDQALQLDPDLPAGHLNLGIVYLQADRPDLAAEHLQQAIRLLPPDQAAQAQDLLAQTAQPERWLRLGDLLLANGEHQAAAHAFEQAAALGAPPADAAVGLSAALTELNEWEAAQAVLEQAIQAAPQDARLYNNLGILAQRQGNLDAARQYFNQAIELAPDWKLPQENLEALPK